MKEFFKKHLYITSISVVLIILIAWFYLVNMGEYGITIFLTIPATIGLIWGYNTEFEKNKSSRKIAFNLFLVLIGLLVFCGLLFFVGIEGVICIAMAIPFIFIPLYLFFLIGMIAGYYERKRTLNSILIFLFFINPASYIFDSRATPIEDTVITEIIVNSSKDRVWQLLSTEISFDRPHFVLFEAGISYPKKIKLINNQGKISYNCKTNNDSLKLEIEEYVKFEKVKFTLENQTIPMKELSPYQEISAKHLHDYFIVEYGEIQLQSISKSQTKLIAKTSYNYRIAPKYYWKLWSNFILDKMQSHVLKSIKTQAEKK